MMRVVVIGAGIVGLHMACALRKKGHEVFLLERDATLGEQTSGRNSGVIHAGIYYQPGSLKEKTCLEGNRLTYEWLERLKVPHRRSGKWLVPEEGQESELEPFFEQLLQLPIPQPRLLDSSELQQEEPALRPLPAIEVPSSGIVDAAGYVRALSVYTEGLGANLLTSCEVQEVNEQSLKTSRGPIEFDLAINCAGLFADTIAQQAGLEGYEIRPCRGDYYLFSKVSLSRPVYHPPYQGALGLGVHLTPTLDGQTLVGPNSFFVEERLDYKHRSNPAAFRRAVEYYLPAIATPSLQPAYSGNRPKLFYQGEAHQDFAIVLEGNWIHLLGIESPGLTAAPALAQEALKRLQ